VGVRVVGPYFDPARPKWCNSFREFLNAIFDHRQCSPVHRLKYHTNDRWERAEFHARCARLRGLIPARVEVHIIRWREQSEGEALHNRYILTDLGGVTFPAGLDEGDPGETDDMSLLDEDLCRLRSSQFDVASSAFDFVDQIVIRGTR